jgi:hypothetical protein
MKTYLITALSALAVLASVTCLQGCGGGGGSANVSLPVAPAPPVGLPIAATSYQNKNLIDTDSVQIPSLRILKNDFGFVFSAEELAAGCFTVGCTQGIVNDRSLAVADFMQDNTYTTFITTWRKTGVHDSYLINRPIIDAKNRAYFIRRENGRWVDKTAQLLPNPDDRYTCISHSYTAVADFNNDGRPDLFVSCHGIDYSFGPQDTVSGRGIQELFPTTWRDIMFEEQIVYLSQTDGSYRKTTVPGKIYGHHASAADINGDGHIDIITTNASWGNANTYEDYRPFFLINNGDGTFTRDYARLPQNFKDPANPNAIATQIHVYWTYLIPIEGRLDLVMVGDKVAWYKNPGNGNFSNVTPTILPLTVGFEASPLDIVYQQGYFYVNHSGGAWPGTMRVKKINAADLSVQTIYTLNQDLGSSEGAISPQFKFSRDGTKLIPFVAGCEKDALAANFGTSKCSIRIGL